eukprot:1069198-Alexandrium_andersonii.AAC.1
MLLWISGQSSRHALNSNFMWTTPVMLLYRPRTGSFSESLGHPYGLSFESPSRLQTAEPFRESFRRSSAQPFN